MPFDDDMRRVTKGEKARDAAAVKAASQKKSPKPTSKPTPKKRSK